jgi:large subunit ribosomal protein L29
MKKNEFIQELSNDELRDRIVEEQDLYTKMKLNHAVSPIENPNKIKIARRLIARLKTEQKQRAMNESKKA